VRELQISDAELQKIIATGIRKKLKDFGFKTGPASDGNQGFFFPINLDLSGEISVVRTADGVWTFTQEDDAIFADRTAECTSYAVAAMMKREAAMGDGPDE
jgi:hypothetical protein